MINRMSSYTFVVPNCIILVTIDLTYFLHVLYPWFCECVNFHDDMSLWIGYNFHGRVGKLFFANAMLQLNLPAITAMSPLGCRLYFVKVRNYSLQSERAHITQDPVYADERKPGECVSFFSQDLIPSNLISD